MPFEKYAAKIPSESLLHIYSFDKVTRAIFFNLTQLNDLCRYHPINQIIRILKSQVIIWVVSVNSAIESFFNKGERRLKWI